MDYIYAGTDEFSREVLKRLTESYAPPLAVITQKAKPKGRGLKIQPTPVAQYAKSINIPAFEVGSFAELQESSFQLPEAKALVVCSFGLYIPEWFLKKFTWTFNFHPSLVPEYRGAAPIQRALLDGKKETGVSIIEVSKEMDAGNIYGSLKVPVYIDDNFESLSKKLIEAGVPLLVSILSEVDRKGSIATRPQEGKVIMAPKIAKEELWIDWSKSAEEIHNQIRAFSPKPGARTLFRGKILKILKSEVCEGTAEPGTVSRVENSFFVVGTGKNLLKIFEVQPEGKKVMGSKEFVNGYRLYAGEMFETKVP